LSLQLQILPVAKAAMSGVDFLLSRLMNWRISPPICRVDVLVVLK
jgi:hypothetical protein